jgi:DNA-binding beta-propeller fold protein YncE
MNLRERLASLAPGAITTVAGAGYSVGIPAREADAGWPMGVARRPDGDLIVIDYHAHRIWRIDRGGSLHMFAGDGVAGFSPDGTLAIEARLDTPYGLAIRADGAVYIADARNNRVRRIAPDGTLQTIAGGAQAGDGGDGGPATQARLNEPHGLCLYGDDILLMSDHFNNKVRAVRL